MPKTGSPDFSISRETLERHTYVIGATRSGKTNFLKSLIVQHMEAGSGVGFIDPHGDDVTELLGCVPRRRIDDVLFFDPTSPTCPRFNILRLSYPAYLLTESIMAYFQMFFSSSWGQRMEHVLRHALLLAITHPAPLALSDLRRLLTQEDYRNDLLTAITDPELLQFWEEEFAEMPDNAVSPIVNKFSIFLEPGSPLQRLFSEPENDIDFSDILNNQKIFLAKLAKGRLTTQPAFLLGGLLVGAIQQATLARDTIPKHERKSFHLFVDEFQNFITESFSDILSGSGKYKLHLSMAHQETGQIPSFLLRSVLGNVGTIISFRISAEDAPIIARQMPGSHIVCRRRESTDTFTVAEFVTYATAYLQQELVHHPTPPRQRSRWREPASWTWADHQHAQIHTEIQSALRVLQSPAITPTVLTELTRKVYGTPDSALSKEQRATLPHPNGRALFSAWEFIEYPYPSATDLVKQPRFHAFARVDGGANVSSFRTFPAPTPDPEIQRLILDRMAALVQKPTPPHPVKEKKPPADTATQSPAPESPPTPSSRLSKTPTVSAAREKSRPKKHTTPA